MPYGRKYKRRRKKNKKALVRRRKPNPWAAYRVPFPKSRKVKLRYSEYGNLTTSTTAIGKYYFRINSLYDPNATGSGDQPRYFDQMCTSELYNSFHVDAVKYKVTFVNKATTDAICAIRFTNNTTFPDAETAEALFHAGEFPKTTVRTLLPKGETGARTTFSGTQTIWPLLAPSKLAYQDIDYAGGYATNPAPTANMYLYTADNPQDASASNVDWYVEIEYYATFYYQRQLASQS